jgi:hypothetical protein
MVGTALVADHEIRRRIRRRLAALRRYWNAALYVVAALLSIGGANVRYWHKADILTRGTNVRYWGKADMTRTWCDLRF